MDDLYEQEEKPKKTKEQKRELTILEKKLMVKGYKSMTDYEIESQSVNYIKLADGKEYHRYVLIDGTLWVK